MSQPSDNDDNAAGDGYGLEAAPVDDAADDGDPDADPAVDDVDDVDDAARRIADGGGSDSDFDADGGAEHMVGDDGNRAGYNAAIAGEDELMGANDYEKRPRPYPADPALKDGDKISKIFLAALRSQPSAVRRRITADGSHMGNEFRDEIKNSAARAVQAYLDSGLEKYVKTGGALFDIAYSVFHDPTAHGNPEKYFKDTATMMAAHDLLCGGSSLPVSFAVPSWNRMRAKENEALSRQIDGPQTKGLIECELCGQFKVVISCEQDRSPDEPTSNIFLCLACGARQRKNN